MSQAIINESTLYSLANVTRTIMSDSKTRTPDECVSDLSGMQSYTGYEYNGFMRSGTGMLDFGDIAYVNLYDIALNATHIKIGDNDVWGVSAVNFPPGTLQHLSSTYRMFYFCNNLISVSLPDGSGQDVTNMSWMVYNCGLVRSVHLPDGFGAKCTTLARAFGKNPSLTDLTLPDSLSGDGINSIAYMCWGDTSLSTLHLPDTFGRGVSAAGSAFNGCSSLSNITGSLNLGVSLDLHYCPLTHESLLNVLNSI